MVSGAVSRLARVRVTLVYAATLAAVSLALAVLGPRIEGSVLRGASTNLDNLGRGHLGTLAASAVVVDAGPVVMWLPGLMSLLALCELQFGSIRLVIAFVTGHLGATALVAAGLLIAVRHGVVPPAVSRDQDVGFSYGAVGVLGALTAAMPRRVRAPWIVWWMGVAVGAAAVEREFTAIGHGLGLVLGILVSTRFGPPTGWSPVRWAMLVVAAGFGFLMLADDGTARAAAATLGAVCAACVGLVAAQRNWSALATAQSACQESGRGSSSSSPGRSHSKSSA